MREKTGQKNSEYEHFSRSMLLVLYKNPIINLIKFLIFSVHGILSLEWKEQNTEMINVNTCKTTLILIKPN